jgi:tetratricopeptide (TPR) repeat protein
MDLEQDSNTNTSGRGGGENPIVGIPNGSACPADSEIFAFYENKLQLFARKKIERHLASCDMCRESLTLLMRLHNEAEYENDAGALAGGQIEADKAQVARVLAAIERDDARQRPVRVPPRRSWLPVPGRAFAAVAAFLVLAMGAFVIYSLCLSESRADAGLQAIAKAVKKERRTTVKVSGLPYSPYSSSLRGGSNSNDLSFENAANKLKFALDKSAPPAARLNLARLYLARSEGADWENAFDILQGLAAAGVQSPDVLNDTGAALVALRHSAEAIDYFNRALAANPKMSEALFNRAIAEQQVDRQAARQDYERFIASASDQQWIGEARDRLKSLE